LSKFKIKELSMPREHDLILPEQACDFVLLEFDTSDLENLVAKDGIENVTDTDIQWVKRPNARVE
jgi:hypothetical protein